MVFISNPHWFGSYADTIFASNYSQVKAYLQRIVKVLNLNYNTNLGYMRFKLKRKDLLSVSLRWTNEVLPLTMRLLDKYKRLSNL